jgi:hypothetical protein
MNETALKQLIAKHLSALPKKMILCSDSEVLADCVLYELSHEICLHLTSVSYFVYNPDFHLCKGVAGILKEDLKEWCKDPWNNHTEFKKIIRSTKFNKSIREILFCTVKHENVNTIGEEIKKTICKSESSFYSWKIKNNNIGIILYEKATQSSFDQEDIENASGLLGFCPI